MRAEKTKMGFGILFIGLTLILTMTAYGVLPAFIGYFICGYGCKKLCEYEEKFKLPALVMTAAGVVGIADTVLAIVGYFGKNETVLNFSGAFGVVMDLVLFLAALTLLPALKKIAADAEREKTAKGCTAAMVAVIALLAVELTAIIVISFGQESLFASLLGWCTLIVPFLLLAVLIALVFSCYMWICPEGEEEMEEETALNRRITSAFKRTEQNDGNNESPARRKNKKKK